MIKSKSYPLSGAPWAQVPWNSLMDDYTLGKGFGPFDKLMMKKLRRPFGTYSEQISPLGNASVPSTALRINLDDDSFNL